MFFKEYTNLFFLFCFFALKTMSLSRKIMETCGLCPAKLWSNADFVPQNPRDFVLCLAKCWRLCSLPAKLWSNANLAPQNQGDIVSGA